MADKLSKPLSEMTKEELLVYHKQANVRAQHQQHVKQYWQEREVMSEALSDIRASDIKRLETIRKMQAQRQEREKAHQRNIAIVNSQFKQMTMEESAHVKQALDAANKQRGYEIGSLDDLDIAIKKLRDSVMQCDIIGMNRGMATLGWWQAYTSGPEYLYEAKIADSPVDNAINALIFVLSDWSEMMMTVNCGCKERR